MAVLNLNDAYAYVAGYDFTTDTNNLMLKADAEAKDATTFGSNGWRQFIGGLKTVAFDMKGFWQSATAGAVDPESFPDLGVANRVFTVGPYDATLPDPVVPLVTGANAYFFQAGKFRYLLPDGPVGELARFELGSMGTAGVGVKAGYLVKPRGDVSATGVLGGRLDSLAGVPGGASLWATVHVFSAGTTITIQVQSDDNVGFASPTTVATIGPLTTAGGTWMTPVPGPIADRYYRFNVSAITGTFNVGAAIAATT